MAKIAKGQGGRPSGCCGGFIGCSAPPQPSEKDWYRSITPKRALKIVQENADAKVFHPMQERVVALAYEEIAKMVVTESGWKLVGPHMRFLLERAIIPTLRFKEQDKQDWQENEENYVQKHLPLILDDVGDDCLTPRRSALKVLALVSMYKKFSGLSKKTKNQGKDETLGESLIMPSLLQIPLPQNSISPTSDAASKYYATLTAYAGLRQFLKMQAPDVVTMIIHTRVIPVFSMSASTPYMLATASWLIGILVSCLPKVLNKEVYSGLMTALLVQNTEECSWRPVRSVAARTILILLQEMYMPLNWLPLLKGAVAGVRMHDMQGASQCFQLLSAFTEAGGPSIARHIPSITFSIELEMAEHIKRHPGSWPQVVGEGFSVMASLAQIWDSSQHSKENAGQNWQNWKAGCAMVASSFSRLLECAWFPVLLNVQSRPRPPSSCLSDASVLLAIVLKYTDSQKGIELLKVDLLLQAWGELVATWKAWEEKEDMVVFEVIDEAVNLQRRFSLPQFARKAHAWLQSTDFPTAVTADSIARFLCLAIESGFSAAASRACRRTHPYLHIFSFSQETLERAVSYLTQSVIKRLKHSKRTLSMHLTKSLILVIATCFLELPAMVESTLRERNSSNHSTIKNGFLRWGEALAVLAASEHCPKLCLHSEFKLAVITLLKVVSHLSDCKEKYGHDGTQLGRHCISSVLEAMSRLKQLELKKLEEEKETRDQDVNEETWVGRSEQYRQYRREQLSKELQKEAEWSLEEEHELDLGMVGLLNEEQAVHSYLLKYGTEFVNNEVMTQNVIEKFLDSFPDCPHIVSIPGL